MTSDRRLIEDFLPIQSISEEASREKSVRKGHISTLHLWWARRPLVACRAAVYGALVPASRFVPDNGPDNRKQSLGRANAAKFVTELCKYPGSLTSIKQAREHILEAHAERLTAELVQATKTGQWPGWVDEFKWPKDKAEVTRENIEAGGAPRPRVLDMFAGGGAIPLEALRLGCEAYALDLNPVAHIIQLCTLVYPQKYGKPDPNEPGMTGPLGKDGKPTWGGLADEVRFWGKWVLERVRREIGDLYPPIPDPEYKDKRPEIEFNKEAGRWVVKSKASEMPSNLFGENGGSDEVPPGYLTPVAYLWTRTVKCKNPACGATVPLVKQTWLCKKKDRYVAMKMVTPREKKEVRFEVVEARSERGIGFDPEAFSSAGNATCLFCGSVADSGYVKNQASGSGLPYQLLTVACSNPRGTGNIFLSAHQVNDAIPKVDLRHFQDEMAKRGFSLPDEPIVGKGADQLPAYGMRQFKDLFLDRPLAFLLTVAAIIRTDIDAQLTIERIDRDHAKALRTILALALDRVANYLSSLCIWRTTRSCVLPTFSRQALAMTWDFGEMSPFAGTAGDFHESCQWVGDVVEDLAHSADPAVVIRTSADAMPLGDETLDAVITDPPYYDNVIYSDLSDFFYVWMKRSVSDLYPEHFGSDLTPKKKEAVSARFRHGSLASARTFYEELMARSLTQAHRVLKSEGALCCIYAHKTTLGWATLVDALRRAGFLVSEAWPIDTEMTGGMRVGTASLASSIFLVGRKRDAKAGTGSYETEVRPELEEIVRERVKTLWDQGITGADLVIACVGAGLRAFTRFSRVEYTNGEEVPAEKFLAEVETVVLESILAQLSKEVGANGGKYGLAGIDRATRFYILWRYTYRWTELDAGEAIIFANGTHVELEGPGSLTHGARGLVEKKKSKYRLRDFADRGEEEKLGLPDDSGSAPLIDALHRALWLMENKPRLLPEFLRESGVNREQMRLVAQALAGPALKGGDIADVSPTGELAALAKMTANWRNVVEDAALTEDEKEGRRTGQRSLFGKENK